MIQESGVIIGTDATEDEAAAILAALTLYLAAANAGLPAPRVDRWARAGRLEAMGLPVTAEMLRRGWRA